MVAISSRGGSEKKSVAPIATAFSRCDASTSTHDFIHSKFLVSLPLGPAERPRGPPSICFADVDDDPFLAAKLGDDLEHASYRLPHFYHGRFVGRIFTDAMIMLARHHRGVRTILGRALVGEQSYVTLKRDLLRLAWRVF
jgi:hypothetical protein